MNFYSAGEFTFKRLLKHQSTLTTGFVVKEHYGHITKRANLFSFINTNVNILSAQHFTSAVKKTSLRRSVLIDNTQTGGSDGHSNGTDKQLFQRPKYDKDFQSEILLNAFKTNSTLNWEHLKTQILEAGRQINARSIDAFILDLCLKTKNMVAAKSYVKYLSSTGNIFNLAMSGKYLRVCYVFREMCTDEDKEIILTICTDLMKKYPLFDANTAESLILGLSVTSSWKDGLRLLAVIKESCSPSPTAYSALVKAAFLNNDENLGWEILHELICSGNKPDPTVYDTWLQINSDQFAITKLLQFFSDNSIYIPEECAKQIQFLWMDFRNSATFTTISSRGVCKSCHQPLHHTALSPSEFQSLSDVFLEKTLVGSDVFLKTKPEELATFKKFMLRTGRVDVVLDGLNVAYAAGARNRTKQHYSSMLRDVVAHFAKRSKKVLVLGRKHMASWPSDQMDYVYNNAAVFLADNVSQDDPLLLYAAMHSGLGTQFVSRDLMRSHKFLLRTRELRLVFTRWQQQHQVHLIYVEMNGKVRLRDPLPYQEHVQCSEDGRWHLPIEEENTNASNPKIGAPPLQWLCLV